MKTTTAKQRTKQGAVKLADFDWRKFLVVTGPTHGFDRPALR
jgi:hypothetical protein